MFKVIDLRFAALCLHLFPMARRLHRAGLTVLGLALSKLAFSLGAALAIGLGYLLIGLALVAMYQIADLFKSPMRWAEGGVILSARQLFLNAIVDHGFDLVVMVGIAWYSHGHLSEVSALLPMGVLAATSLRSFVHGRAEVLGSKPVRGLMGRMERTLAMGLGLLLPALLAAMLWLILVGSLVASLMEFGRLWLWASEAEGTHLQRRSFTRRQLHESRQSAQNYLTDARRERHKGQNLGS